MALNIAVTWFALVWYVTVLWLIRYFQEPNPYLGPVQAYAGVTWFNLTLLVIPIAVALSIMTLNNSLNRKLWKKTGYTLAIPFLVDGTVLTLFPLRVETPIWAKVIIIIIADCVYMLLYVQQAAIFRTVQSTSGWTKWVWQTTWVTFLGAIVIQQLYVGAFPVLYAFFPNALTSGNVGGYLAVNALWVIVIVWVITIGGNFFPRGSKIGIVFNTPSAQFWFSIGLFYFQTYYTAFLLWPWDDITGPQLTASLAFLPSEIVAMLKWQNIFLSVFTLLKVVHAANKLFNTKTNSVPPTNPTQQGCVQPSN
jgi:hypothetical protein